MGADHIRITVFNKHTKATIFLSHFYSFLVWGAGRSWRPCFLFLRVVCCVTWTWIPTTSSATDSVYLDTFLLTLKSLPFTLSFSLASRSQICLFIKFSSKVLIFFKSCFSRGLNYFPSSASFLWASLFIFFFLAVRLYLHPCHSGHAFC